MFHWVEICSLLARFLYCLSAAFLIPLGFGLGLRETVGPFWVAFLICLGCAGLLQLLSKESTGELRRREGIFLVVLIWLVASFFAAIPFYWSGVLANPIDAYFEAMSGLTTTGSSLIADVESAPLPILLWRSLLQWFGGIGIVVLFLMILPVLRVGGKILYETEATGPIKEGISPLAKVAATKITLLYGALTALSFFLLLATQTPLFDAINLALTTISTGGFSVRNNSVDAYSAATKLILALFMILGSINFSLYFQWFRKRSPEFLFFLGSVLVGCMAVAFFSDKGWIGCFQAISAQTTTGYSSDNPNMWPIASQTILILLMFIGGMAGSTAGGLKTSRFYLLFQVVRHRLESLFRPSIVRTLRIGEREIDTSGALTLLTFFCLVGFFVVLSFLALIIAGIPPSSSIAFVASFLNNSGLNPPVDFNSPFLRMAGIFLMLLGRLEYMVVSLVFLPSFWRNR